MGFILGFVAALCVVILTIMGFFYVLAGGGRLRGGELWGGCVTPILILALIGVYFWRR